MSPRRCPRSALPLLCTLLAAAVLHAAHATAPPDPSTCNPSSDIYNTNVNLTAATTVHNALLEYGTTVGISATCLNNSLHKLRSCETDLTKISGCCSQSCWDALRDPTVQGDCFNSLILGTCKLAEHNNNTMSGNTSAVSGLLDALFFTYNDCVEVSRVPYTCTTFAAMLSTPSSPSASSVGYGGYGGVGYGGYGGVGYGGYGGVGYGGYGSVGYGGYGAVGYGGYFFTATGGMGYEPYTPVRRQALADDASWQTDSARRVHRRLHETVTMRRKTSALASVLRRLRQH